MRGFVLAVAAAAVVACGGSEFKAGGAAAGGDASLPDGALPDGGGDDAGKQDGGDAGLTPLSCPSSPPTATDECKAVGVICEYGNDANADCNNDFRCDATGHWVTWNDGNAPKTCPTPTATTNTNCPANRQLVPVQQPCQDSTLECAYVEGICACTTSSTGGPSSTAKWRCPTPGSSCPVLRPRIGASCSNDGQQCDYGKCVYRGGVALTCTRGVWQPDMSACPL